MKFYIVQIVFLALDMMPVEWMDVTVVVRHLNRFTNDSCDIGSLVRHHVGGQISHQMNGM